MLIWFITTSGTTSYEEASWNQAFPSDGNHPLRSRVEFGEELKLQALYKTICLNESVSRHLDLWF